MHGNQNRGRHAACRECPIPVPGPQALEIFPDNHTDRKEKQQCSRYAQLKQVLKPGIVCAVVMHPLLSADQAGRAEGAITPSIGEEADA